MAIGLRQQQRDQEKSAERIREEARFRAIRKSGALGPERTLGNVGRALPPSDPNQALSRRLGKVRPGAIQQGVDLKAQEQQQRTATAKKRDPFDILKQRAEQETAESTKAEQEQIAGRLAARGIGARSGVSREEGLRIDLQQRKALARRVGDIDIQKALAEEQRAETARGRQFLTGERVGGEQFLGGEAGLGREFVTGERLGSESFARRSAGQSRAFGAEETRKGRVFQTGERLGSEKFAAEAAASGRTFTTSERKDRETFLTDATAQDFSNALERDSTQQGFNLQNINATGESQEKLAGVNSNLAIERMDAQDAIGDLNFQVESGANFLYERGLSGEVVSTAELATLPLVMQEAYKAGLAGENREKFLVGVDRSTKFMNALILTLDPADARFSQDLGQIALKFGVDLDLGDDFGGGGDGDGDGPPTRRRTGGLRLE